jgi:hypothetical protein
MLLPKEKSADPPKYVKLLKSIYGLKQAGALWNQFLTNVLLKLHFIQAPCDPCVFTKFNSDTGEDIDICLHVDDILCSATNINHITTLHSELTTEFGEVNDTTTTHTHLGLKWNINSNGSITITQPGYIDKIIKDLQLQDSSPTFLPFETLQSKSHTLQHISSSHSDTYTNQLRHIIGLLSHAALKTRPDIMYAVSELATKVTTATLQDIHAALHIAKYLQTTKTLGITFASDVGTTMEAFFDASHLTHSDGKGHSGMVYRLGSKSTAAFGFKSKKNTLVTRSSTDSEIFTADLGCYDIEWIRQLLQFLHIPQHNPTIIHEDNRSCIDILTGNGLWNDKSKHVTWRYNYILQAIKEKTVKFEYVKSEEQIADILTKNITIPKQFYHIRALLLNCPDNKDGI